MLRTILVGAATLSAVSAAADELPASAVPISPYDGPAGSGTGYGSSGQLTLGAAFGLTLAGDVRDVSGALWFGRFLAERFALSALASVAHVRAGAQSATLWSMLIEPSYHLPLDRRTFGVIGMGVGLAYQAELGTGLAVAPRIGVGFLVGRHGVVTPALAYSYVTHRALGGDDVAVAAAAGALRIQVGYAVTW